MNHLTPDEFIDAVEGTLLPARQAHVRECNHCRLHVAQMTTMLNEVRGVGVPEPSPLFWDYFPDWVRRAIAVEPAVPPRLARWFQWPVLVPLTALASIVLVLASAVPERAVGLVDSEMAVTGIDTAPEADAAVDPDADWELMAALAAGVDFDTTDQSALDSAPGAADEAVMQLSAAEQQELLRLLREELQHSGG